MLKYDMDLEKYDDLRQRLDQAHTQVLPMRVDKTDFRRIERTCERLLANLTQEEVLCRRLDKPTYRYQELLEQAEEAMKTFEGYILIAKLSYKEPE